MSEVPGRGLPPMLADRGPCIHCQVSMSECVDQLVGVCCRRCEHGPAENDAVPLREWVADIPRVSAWIEAQTLCPGCGASLDERGGCFRAVSSVWCQTKRLHHTPPKIAPARVQSP